MSRVQFFDPLKNTIHPLNITSLLPSLILSSPPSLTPLLLYLSHNVLLIYQNSLKHSFPPFFLYFLPPSLTPFSSTSLTGRNGSDRTRCVLNNCVRAWAWAWAWRRTFWRAWGAGRGVKGAPPATPSPSCPPPAALPTSSPPPSTAPVSSPRQDSSLASPTPLPAPCDLFPTSHDL